MKTKLDVYEYNAAWIFFYALITFPLFLYEQFFDKPYTWGEMIPVLIGDVMFVTG